MGAKHHRLRIWTLKKREAHIIATGPRQELVKRVKKIIGHINLTFVLQILTHDDRVVESWTHKVHK